MRKSLLLYLCLLFAAATQAQTTSIALYGTVTAQGTGNPVANHTVYISNDSLSSGFTYFGTVQTDANGFFIDTIFIPSATNITWYLSTLDCNSSWITNTAQTTTTGLTFGNPSDFTICANSPGNCAAFFSVNSNSFTGTANFSATVANATYPITLSWDFGDGSPAVVGSTSQSHTYLQSGVYTTCLTMNDAGGCTYTYCDSVVVNYQAGCTAAFNSILNPNYAYTYNFDNQSSGYSSVEWILSDGTTATSSNLLHTFPGPGTYAVTLILYDGNGQYCDSAMQVLTLAGNPVSCAASFLFYADSLNIIQFIDSSYNASTWSWDFGDGSTGSGSSPVHTYQPGIYQVCLTIGDGAGCTDTYCDTLNIPAGPAPCAVSLGAYPDTTSANGLTYQFYSNATGGTAPYTYSWDFGDSTGTATSAYPVYTYATPGVYYVCVTVTDANGCISTSCQWISITNFNLFAIGGFVSAGSFFNFPQDFTVYLITHDSTTNTLSAVDSLSLSLTPGDSGFYVFTAPAGTYTTKAALNPSDPDYWNYLPTYYGDELMWSDATFSYVNGSQYFWDIELIAGSNPGGPGFIGGNVFAGANKSSAGIDHAQVILFDMNDNPIAYTYSDTEGAFAFDSLAYGTYKVHTEVLGLPTTPVIVTLDATTPAVTTVEVEVGENAVTTRIDVASSLFFDKIGKSYPNPAHDRANLEVEIKQFVTLDLRLQNAVGQVVQTRQYSLGQGTHQLKIDLQSLPTGIYFLRIDAEGKEQTTQKLIRF